MRSCLISTMALLCASPAAFAQAPNKVGVISIQGAIVGTKDGQKASQELETKFGPKKKEFQTRESELGQLNDQLTKGGSVMAEDKRAQLAREIDEKKKRLDRDMQDAQEDFQAEQQRLFSGCEPAEHTGSLCRHRYRYHSGNCWPLRQNDSQRRPH